MIAISESAITGADAYFTAAKIKVRDGYRLWALKEQMRQLADSYKHSGQAVSDAKFYALRDAIAEVEGRMN